MQLLGRRWANGVLEESYYDPSTMKMYVKTTDHASLIGKRINQKAQSVDTKRRQKPGDGEYSIFRMTVDDRKALAKLYPDLEHTDPEIRTEAWNRLRYTPLSRPFQMTRPPGQDKVSFSKPPTPSIILP